MICGLRIMSDVPTNQPIKTHHIFLSSPGAEIFFSFCISFLVNELLLILIFVSVTVYCYLKLKIRFFPSVTTVNPSELKAARID